MKSKFRKIYKDYYQYYAIFYIFMNISLILSQFVYNPAFLFKYGFQFNYILNQKSSIYHRFKIDFNSNIHRAYKYIYNNIISSRLSPFPIDLVYTWVDGRDEKWLKEMENASIVHHKKFKKKDFLNRFVDIEEIRYSLRSVEQNLPWIRYIFIVTWGNQRPYWINLSNPRIKIISQSEIFPETVKLPTFNSKAIDFSLHKIPGLSEHFIYSNDDMFFCQSLKYSDFFTIEGKPIIYSQKKDWSDAQKIFRRFDSSYKKSPNDGTLFMISVYFTILNFYEKFKKIMNCEYSHIPTAFTKTICEEVYSNFKDEIDKTISHRFRSRYDFQMQTLMIQFGLVTNQSVVKFKTRKIALFVVTSFSNIKFKRMYEIIDNPPKLLSVNTDDMNSRERIKAFLDFIFDKPSSFELLDKPPNVDQHLKGYYSDRKSGEFYDWLEYFTSFFKFIKILFIGLLKKTPTTKQDLNI